MTRGPWHSLSTRVLGPRGPRCSYWKQPPRRARLQAGIQVSTWESAPGGPLGKSVKPAAEAVGRTEQGAERGDGWGRAVGEAQNREV